MKTTKTDLPRLTVVALTPFGEQCLEPLRVQLDWNDIDVRWLFTADKQAGGENWRTVQSAIEHTDVTMLFCDSNDARMTRYIDEVRRFGRRIVLVGDTPQQHVSRVDEFDLVIPVAELCSRQWTFNGNTIQKICELARQ